MCILELSKILMYVFHCDYIKNKYGNNSRLLFTDTYSLMSEMKLKMFMKILAVIKKCLTFVIIQLSQNNDNSNKLVVRKRKVVQKMKQLVL